MGTRLATGFQGHMTERPCTQSNAFAARPAKWTLPKMSCALLNAPNIYVAHPVASFMRLQTEFAASFDSLPDVAQVSKHAMSGVKSLCFFLLLCRQV